MGLREDAYLKYILGRGGTLKGDAITPEMLPYVQKLTAKAYDKPEIVRGQLLYSDYPEQLNNGFGELKATIGRTGIGQIERQGNNWRIRDTYDFNPVEGGVMGDIKYGC